MKWQSLLKKIMIVGMVFLIGLAGFATPSFASDGQPINPDTATKEQLKELWDPANYIYTGDIRHLNIEEYRQSVHSLIDAGYRYFKYTKTFVTVHREDQPEFSEDYWIVIVFAFSSKNHDHKYYIEAEGSRRNRLFSKIEDGKFAMIHPERKGIPFEPIGYYIDRVIYIDYFQIHDWIGTEVAYLSSDQNQLIEIPNEYISPTPPAMGSIKVIDVGPDYASLEWSAVPNVDGYRIEFWEDEKSDEKNYVDVESTNVKLMNLKGSTFYWVHLRSIRNGVVSDRRSTANFRTLDATMYLKVYHGEDLLSLNAQTLAYNYKHIVIESRGYDFIDVKVNGTNILSSQTYAQNIIEPDMYAHLGNSGVYDFRIEAKNYLGKYDTYQFGLFNPNEYDGYPDPGGLKPTPPEKPEKSWDIVGWVQYIWEWLMYIVETVVYFIGQAGSMITQVFSQTSGLVRVLQDFFAFLPGNITTLIGVGITLGILLRIFKR